MSGFAARERLGQRVARRVRKLGRKLLDRLDFTLQLEAEILQLPLQHERAVLPPRVVNHFYAAASGVAANQLHRNLGPLDRGARNPGAIREIPKVPGDRPPASTHACLRDPGFAAVGRLLVDHQIERHELSEQLRELAIDVIASVHHFRGQLHAESAEDARGSECGIFDRFDEHTALFRPLLDALVE